MPSMYAHALHARNVSAVLSGSAAAIINAAPDYYLLGSLGADPYSADLFKPYPKGANRMHIEDEIHKLPGDMLIGALLPIAAGKESTLAYALGFVCHLALDNTVHPLICAQCANDKIRHSEYEMRMDLSLRDGGDDARLMRRPNRLYGAARRDMSIAALQNALVKTLLDVDIGQDYRRCLDKFLLLQELAYDPHGRKLRFYHAMERVFSKKILLSRLLLTNVPPPDADLFNRSHSAWAAPWDADHVRCESYETLFHTAIQKGAVLVGEAAECLQSGRISDRLIKLSHGNMEGDMPLP